MNLWVCVHLNICLYVRVRVCIHIRNYSKIWWSVTQCSTVLQTMHSATVICVTLSVLQLQGGKDPQDALSLQVIFCKRALWLLALLRKMTCNLWHPVGLRHPVVEMRCIAFRCVVVCCDVLSAQCCRHWVTHISVATGFHYLLNFRDLRLQISSTSSVLIRSTSSVVIKQNNTWSLRIMRNNPPDVLARDASVWMRRAMMHMAARHHCSVITATYCNTLYCNTLHHTLSCTEYIDNASTAQGWRTHSVLQCVAVCCCVLPLL